MVDSEERRKVTDERVMLEFLLTSDPAMFTSEIAERLPVTRQRVGQMLDTLESEGFVTSKHAAGRRLWWLTEKGEEYITSVARERLS